MKKGLLYLLIHNGRANKNIMIAFTAPHKSNEVSVEKYSKPLKKQL